MRFFDGVLSVSKKICCREVSLGCGCRVLVFDIWVHRRLSIGT